MTAMSASASLEDLLRPGYARDNAGAWRWSVRRHLVPVRDRLLREHPDRREAWLSARATRALRERDELLARLNGLTSQVMVAVDLDALADRLSRLLVDIERPRLRRRRARDRRLGVTSDAGARPPGPDSPRRFWSSSPPGGHHCVGDYLCPTHVDLESLEVPALHGPCPEGCRSGRSEPP
jgi:hypothetical protein